ncbi:MAG: squalene/phytoene synthase family protein, partial [Myxococcota bacterium]
MTDWELHLEKTSRTFALAIPLLDEPLRREVTLSYLLFRVADTLEDASTWPASLRSESLRTCAKLIRQGDGADVQKQASRWLSHGVTAHAGYQALLEAFPELLEDTRRLPAASVARIEHHVLRTIERMDDFVRRADGDGTVVLRSKRDLEAYCYAVAGIVGELLTDLFVLQVPRLRNAT